ncbi:MAG: hypothetical protein COB16_12700 [Rhodobacteraceae bacterium]|nr:MAG: hypothetical protein COB16_12700 [Paracoccaceae bacterium]
MSNYDKNLTRALAILATDVDECDVVFEAHSVVVRGQHLNPLVDDDCEVLAILMADKEFGFAVSAVERITEVLRAKQKVWRDAAANLKPNSWFAENSPMTDKRALEEVNSAVEVLQRHWDCGFLLGIWQEQMDGILYRFTDGCYESRALSDAEAA